MKVFKMLIDQYASGQDTSLLDQIDNFVTAQSIIQQVSNPSGTITTGGLGEPKFNINETAFTDPWGRSVLVLCCTFRLIIYLIIRMELDLNEVMKKKDNDLLM